MSTKLLSNKTLLVTGAGRGIGYAIVECALREGANVVAHVGRSLPVESMFDKYASEQVLILTGDLSLPSDIEFIWQSALAWKNRIDVLVNNAGVYVPSPLEPASDWDAGWHENLSINLQAPAALCRMAIKHNQETQEGTIDITGADYVR